MRRQIPMYDLTAEQQLRLRAVEQAVKLHGGQSNAASAIMPTVKEIFEFLSEETKTDTDRRGKHERPRSGWEEILDGLGDWAKTFGQPPAGGRY
jgi:hypothetical protein